MDVKNSTAANQPVTVAQVDKKTDVSTGTTTETSKPVTETTVTISDEARRLSVQEGDAQPLGDNPGNWPTPPGKG